MTHPTSTKTRLARLAAATGLALALGACADRVVQTSSVYPYDHRERHPIVLAEAPTVLDVLVRGPGLDERQRLDVKAFVADYRANGSGPLHVQAPQGGDELATRRTLEHIRHAVVEAGLPTSYLSTSAYRPSDPTLAAAIRLSFRKLQAQVRSRCGQWPNDLGVSDLAFNLRNEPHWNFGCATQTTIAAQTADPVDLVRGRAPAPADVSMRTRDIESLREGESPSTSWPELRR